MCPWLNKMIPVIRNTRFWAFTNYLVVTNYEPLAECVRPLASQGAFTLGELFARMRYLSNSIREDSV